MSVRTVKRRDRKSGATRQFIMIDIDYQHPDGRRERVRRVSPVQTTCGAKRYEQRIRAALYAGKFGREENTEPVQTLEQFESRFIDEWCRGNKHKPSGIEGKESVFRNYLIPLFGKRRLDTFTATDEDKLKKHFIEYSAATYNNAATLMNVVLKAAVRWKVIRVVPHHFGLLKRQKARPRFLDFDQYEWLVEAASKIDKRTLVVVLLGGDAGLRRGEIIAMDWANVDLRRGLLTVERSEWKGNVTATKGMKYRVVPMTKRLQEALAEHRHLRGDRVLYTDDGKTVTAKVLQNWMWKAQKRAGLRATGALHILRHTFCSHLAMRGAPALSIQKLAGHEDLGTTLGYMHLAQGETERAIRLLDDRSSMLGYGNLTATEGDQKINVSN